MAKVIQIEQRKRGFFGKIFLLVFWSFNALMAFWLFGGVGSNVNSMQTLATDAERAGFAAGTAIGAGMLIILWMAGAVILGIFVMLTRGNKVIIEKVEQ